MLLKDPIHLSLAVARRDPQGIHVFFNVSPVLSCYQGVLTMGYEAGILFSFM